ncbi:MAG: nucleotidyltransferase domain-containing protein [Lentimicrobium sp.]|nr:nucleotidyltransferase domain-containing protein [Lentimicrobium sp.]
MINPIVLQRLKEREKELNTLYRLNSLLTNDNLKPAALFPDLISFLPMGFRYTTICETKIAFEGSEWKSDDFRETPWMLSADIEVDNNICGKIQVVYTQLIDDSSGNQFFPEEQKLLNTTANRIGNYFFQQRLKNTVILIQTGKESGNNNGNGNGESVLKPDSDQHWKWRLRMAERISELIDFRRLGVKAIYLIGSAKNANAGPASDIDLLIHHKSDVQQLNCLKAWIEGWSLCLAEENFQKTGYQTEGLIDLHLITDKDIEEATSFAVMIGAVTDSARLLKKFDY